MNHRLWTVWSALLVIFFGFQPSLSHAEEPSKPAPKPPGMWETDVFPVSFWCGPPENFEALERYQQIKDAGFTYVMPPCNGGSTPEVNKKILDYCQQVGLKVFLQDKRMPGVANPKDKETMDTIVKDYSSHPAFAGYFIGDEPSAGAFGNIGAVVGYLRDKDPAHVAYANLYPNYCPPSGLGTPTYDQYVRAYIGQVKPAIVSYDHYHFMNHFDRSGFFDNLEVVRRASLEANLPFWQIVLCINHFDYRPLNEAEKRWEAMQTLAYGGKGLMWFTYWQPDESGMWGTAIITAKGVPTKQYEEIKRVNHDVVTIGKYLLKAKNVQTFQFGQPGDATNTGADVVSFSAPRVTVGVFEDGDTKYVMLANRDYRDSWTVPVMLSNGGQQIEKLDKATDQWSAIPGEMGKRTEVVAPLKAGDGELYRWSKAKPSTAPAEMKKY